MFCFYSLMLMHNTRQTSKSLFSQYCLECWRCFKSSICVPPVNKLFLRMVGWKSKVDVGLRKWSAASELWTMQTGYTWYAVSNTLTNQQSNGACIPRKRYIMRKMARYVPYANIFTFSGSTVSLYAFSQCSWGFVHLIRPVCSYDRKLELEFRLSSIRYRSENVLMLGKQVNVCMAVCFISSRHFTELQLLCISKLQEWTTKIRLQFFLDNLAFGWSEDWNSNKCWDSVNQDIYRKPQATRNVVMLRNPGHKVVTRDAICPEKW